MGFSLDSRNLEEPHNNINNLSTMVCSIAHHVFRVRSKISLRGLTQATLNKSSATSVAIRMGRNE